MWKRFSVISRHVQTEMWFTWRRLSDRDDTLGEQLWFIHSTFHVRRWVEATSAIGLGVGTVGSGIGAGLGAKVGIVGTGLGDVASGLSKAIREKQIISNGNRRRKPVQESNLNRVLRLCNGFPSKDLAVSRRQISFRLSSPPHQQENQTAPRVSFEVIGRNPIWVISSKKDADPRAFKRFERGELGVDDMFCVSAKNPIWFRIRTLKRATEVDGRKKEGKFEEREIGLSESLEIGSANRELGLESIDISSVDPVKCMFFGFLVIGREFDNYPNQMMCDIKSWNWFLDDPREDSEDEVSVGSKEKRGARRKRKKTKGDARDAADDEDWTGESGY
ncbi:hypothetical protein Ancab_029841 [Ancistrocladus abbreviatus]